MSNSDSNSLGLTKKQERFFGLAKNVSTLSDFKQFHLGCIITYKNKIVSDGFNTTKTSPMQKKYNKLRDYNNNFDIPNNGACHAEMVALLRSKDMDIDWSKAELYIYRQHKNGNLAMSRCCSACMQAIKDRGIRRIAYTTEDGVAFERIG